MISLMRYSSQLNTCLIPVPGCCGPCQALGCHHLEDHHRAPEMHSVQVEDTESQHHSAMALIDHLVPHARDP